MSRVLDHELPDPKRDLYRKAVRLEWITIAYDVSVVIVIYLALGSSQAMKAAWIEDLLAFAPPIAFLVAARVRDRPSDSRYEYGYHRVVSIAFLVAALALFVLGLYIVYDSVARLVSFEHPPIGLVELFGRPIWLGWLMIAALLWGLVPPVILGRLKLPVARELHDKVLYADAEMNRANWLTAGAAILGVLGIRFGLWWTDAVAAIVIGIDITRDGIVNTRSAVGDLMDRRPMAVGTDRTDPLPARIETELKKLSWVKDARVRMRDEGHVFYGEAFVVPADERNLLDNLADATRDLMALDWRIYDLVISPVSHLEEPQELSRSERDQGNVTPETT